MGEILFLYSKNNYEMELDDHGIRFFIFIVISYINNVLKSSYFYVSDIEY